MAIQWYPGHMNKLKQTLKQILPFVDVVLEIADSRAPLSTRNPMIKDLLGKKPHLLLLNKAELADPKLLKSWQNYFKTHTHLKAIAVSAKLRTNLDRIKGEVHKLFVCKNQQQIRNPRALIIGVPNCGKSTIINALARQHKAKAANKPGVTQQVTLYHAQSLDIYDTPGLLWPNLENQDGAARLAALAAVRDEVYLPSEAFSLIYFFLKQHYAERFQQRYQIPMEDNSDQYLVALSTILNKKNIETIALSLFHDLRGGKLGQFCLETPPYVSTQAIC